MTNPRTNRMTSCVTDVRARWLLSLLLLACCTNDLATQTVSPLERQVTTNAVTRVRDAGGGGAVEGFLRFHNTGTTAVRVVLMSCPFQLAAYRKEARQGVPAWADRRVCTLEPLTVALPAGARDSVSMRVSFREILGDSLPEARYYFALRTGYEVLPLPDLPGPTEPKAYVLTGGAAMLHR